MFSKIQGRLERLLLSLGMIKISHGGQGPQGIFDILEKEGFVISDDGIPVEFIYWNSFTDCGEDSIKVIFPSEISYLTYYLEGDIIPPNGIVPRDVDLPTVSVTTSVFNSERYFDRYLNQLKAIDYPKELLEIIIIDDGSSDKELVNDLVREISLIFPNVKFHRNHENRGVFFSKMTGSKIATGKYITFWDVDDIYDPLQIRFLATHNELLRREGYEEFLISSPNVILDERNLKPVTVWKTAYKDPIQLLIEGALTFHGTVSITSSLLLREYVENAYDILMKKYRVLDIVPNLSVPEDVILVNQMIMAGFIKRIFPISYTARGHVRGVTSTSGDLERRAKEIPLFVAIILDWLCSNFDQNVIFEILKNNNAIINRVIRSYGIYSKVLLDNLKNFEEFYGLDTRCPYIYEVFRTLTNMRWCDEPEYRDNFEKL